MKSSGAAWGPRNAVHGVSGAKDLLLPFASTGPPPFRAEGIRRFYRFSASRIRYSRIRPTSDAGPLTPLGEGDLRTLNKLLAKLDSPGE